MMLIIGAIFVAIASVAAYMFLMASPEKADPKKVEKTIKAKDAEKEKLKAKMNAKKTHYFDAISQEVSQNNGGAKDSPTSPKDIQATISNPDTGAEEMLAITTAFAKASKEKQFRGRTRTTMASFSPMRWRALRRRF